MLEKKDSQYQALQKEHKQLQVQYEKLLAASQGDSTLSTTATLAPTDLLSTDPVDKDGSVQFNETATVCELYTDYLSWDGQLSVLR